MKALIQAAMGHVFIGRDFSIGAFDPVLGATGHRHLRRAAGGDAADPAGHAGFAGMGRNVVVASPRTSSSIASRSA